MQGSWEGGGEFQVEEGSALSPEPPPCQAQAVRRDTVGATHHPALVGPLTILKPEAFEES